MEICGMGNFNGTFYNDAYSTKTQLLLLNHRINPINNGLVKILQLLLKRSLNSIVLIDAK